MAVYILKQTSSPDEQKTIVACERLVFSKGDNVGENQPNQGRMQDFFKKKGALCHNNYPNDCIQSHISYYRYMHA